MSLLKTCEKKEPRSQKNLRLSKDDLKKIKEKADTHCRGNVSEWIRYAALNFVPTESDLLK